MGMHPLGKREGEKINGQTISGKRSPGSKKLPISEGSMKFYKHFMWRDPVDLQDPDTTVLKKRVEEYFEYCVQLKMMPLRTNLAIALGYGQSYIRQISQGACPAPREVVQVLRTIDRIFEDVLAQKGIDDSFSSTFVIWLQKNFYDYRDNQEITIQHTNLLSSDTTSADVMRRYALASVPEIEQRDIIPAEFTELQAADVVPVETAETTPSDALQATETADTDGIDSIIPTDWEDGTLPISQDQEPPKRGRGRPKGSKNKPKKVKKPLKRKPKE